MTSMFIDIHISQRACLLLLNMDFPPETGTFVQVGVDFVDKCPNIMPVACLNRGKEVVLVATFSEYCEYQCTSMSGLKNSSVSVSGESEIQGRLAPGRAESREHWDQTPGILQ